MTLLINWSDSLSTGVNEQDAQHKKLIYLINQLYDAVQADKVVGIHEEILEELLHYTENHFSYEEKLMAQYNYAETAIHIDEHAKFTQTIIKLTKELDSGTALITIEVIDLLFRWLMNHIIKTDKQLGASLNKLGVK